jgi:hypothetical protein
MVSVLVDRKSVRWIVISAMILAAAGVWYAIYAPARIMGPSGASWPGLAFGTAGTLIIIFCMLLSVRKWRRSSPKMGSAQAWMRAHVWLGTISYPLIWMHAGFRWGGTLTTVLMILFTIVWLSGIIGLYLQSAVPWRLLRDVPRTTVYQQIPHVIGTLRESAQEVMARAAPRAVGAPQLVLVAAAARAQGSVVREADEAAAVLRSLYDAQVVPLLVEKLPPRAANPESVRRLASEFDVVRRQLPDALQVGVIELESFVRQRLQLERQRRLHRFMHFWLLFHVPASYAMLVFSGVHIVYALRYSRLG